MSESWKWTKLNLLLELTETSKMELLAVLSAPCQSNPNYFRQLPCNTTHQRASRESLIQLNFSSSWECLKLGLQTPPGRTDRGWEVEAQLGKAPKRFPQSLFPVLLAQSQGRIWFCSNHHMSSLLQLENSIQHMDPSFSSFPSPALSTTVPIHTELH